MYRCNECNTQYSKKPDYCECGNDSFEFIDEAPVKKTLTLEQKSEIVSKVFFVICIIFAIIICFIPVSKETKPAAEKPIKTEKTIIPDIDKFWDDTPIYQPQVSENKVIEQEDNNIISKIFKNPEIIKKPISKPVQKSEDIKQKPKTKVNPSKDKIKIPDKTLQAANAPANPPKTQTPQQKKQQPKVEQKSVQQTVQQTNPSKTSPKYNPNSSAMIDYKTKLRAQLFSKFAVGSVQGSGSCSISFSVDKSGKLINRKFVQESDNKSLNDTVYYMLMSVPYFTTPPAGYNGETIHMNFKMDNGSYEISIY